MKKHVTPQERPNLIDKPQEVSKQELGQVTGASVNPLYTPLTQGGTNPLYKNS
jgi:hypothetical protein